MISVKHKAVSLQEALQRAPTLAHLSELAAESTARLQAVLPLLPPGLRELVRAGAVDETSWCMLVPHNAAAAKLKHLLPTLLSQLKDAGHAVDAIRIKVERAH